MSDRRPLYALIFSMLLWSIGCKQNGEQPSPQPTTAAAADTVSGPPERIVSLAPSVTETLFALGAGERIVGVTRFCDFPPEATKLQKVGGLTDVDVEVVLSLEPDLVVGVSSKTSSGLEKTLAAADVDILFLPVETFADVEASMHALAARVGQQQRGEELAEEIAATNAPNPEGPQVLVLFGREPWIAAGPNTFADEMIRRAGGRNVLADLDQPYPTLDAERLSALKADVIFDTSWGDGEQTPIPAADPDSVVRVDPALIRPGPRLSEAMQLFASAVAAQSEPVDE